MTDSKVIKTMSKESLKRTADISTKSAETPADLPNDQIKNNAILSLRVWLIDKVTILRSENYITDSLLN